MADPVLANHYRAQVVFPSVSAIPQDAIVNSIVLHDVLGTAASIAEAATAIASWVSSFYTVAHPNRPGSSGTPTAIKGFFHGALMDPANVHVKVYDLGQPPGSRFPEQRPVAGMAPFVTGGLPLPEEVAAVMTTVAGQNRPRRRGRIFLGGLTNTAMVAVGGKALIAPTFLHAIANAGHWATVVREGMLLQVLSIADGAAYAVTGGWVDNALDTMRSRGPDATERRQYGAYLGQ